MRLLLVEDHPSLRELVAAHLSGRGFVVDAVGCGEAALAALAATAYDALVLDLGLPDMDGVEVLRRSRAGQGRADTPTLILTARDAVSDRVGGLDAGADDYLVKPFEFAELDARLRAVLRRPGSRRAPVQGFGDIGFDTVARAACVGGATLDLTRRELSVLEELVRAEGRIVVKDALEDRLYGADQEVSANALEAAISRLRRRLAQAGSTVGVQATRGVGYRLVLAAPAPGPGPAIPARP